MMVKSTMRHAGHRQSEVLTSKRHIDDSLTVYMRQMGRIPMMAYSQELATTEEMFATRLALRRQILTTDFALRHVLETLLEIRDGKRRADRVVTVPEGMDKQQFVQYLDGFIGMLRNVLRDNRLDFHKANDPRVSARDRRDAWRRVIARRGESAASVKKLEIRMDLLLSNLKPMIALCEKMVSLDERCRSANEGDERRESQPREQLIELQDVTHDSPRMFARRLKKVLALHQRYVSLRSALVASNLRLVINIAKGYRDRGMNFVDLIQEGNTGLIRAADLFDHRLGYKFCTYATWWIRQAIGRAITDKSRTIRLPDYQVQRLKEIQKTKETLTQKHGREPCLHHVAEETGIAFRSAATVMAVNEPFLGLDAMADDDDVSEQLADPRVSTPVEQLMQSGFSRQITTLLGRLEEREREVLNRRFGFVTDGPHTLREIGEHMSLSRERVRQIEKSALAKLKREIDREQLVA